MRRTIIITLCYTYNNVLWWYSVNWSLHLRERSPYALLRLSLNFASIVLNHFGDLLYCISERSVVPNFKMGTRKTKPQGFPISRPDTNQPRVNHWCHYLSQRLRLDRGRKTTYGKRDSFFTLFSPRGACGKYLVGRHHFSELAKNTRKTRVALRQKDAGGSKHQPEVWWL